MAGVLGSDDVVIVKMALPKKTWGHLATIASNRGDQVKAVDVIWDLIMRETTGERFKHAAKAATWANKAGKARATLQELVDEGLNIAQIAERKHISVDSARRAVRRLAREGAQA